MPLAVGQRIAHYEIVSALGAGGMGEVYRARDTRLEREVALKVLPEAFVEDEDRLRRFEREARTLASLSHPNIAQIHEIGQVGDVCFLALELVPGEDLARRLARGPLPVEEALEVCARIADGLAAAHDSGVVHRDLKPANVSLAPDGTVKLLDFGLAKPLSAARDGDSRSSTSEPDSFLVTEEGLVLGTPTYMSPEQARGRAVDRRTDVWAFGCVLYECLTGRRAFEGQALADVLAAIVQREPDLSRLPPGTPPRVVELLERTLAKDPRRRLQHLGDARVELERAREDPGRAPVGPRGRPGVAPRSLAMLAAGVVLGGVATWLALGVAGGGEERLAGGGQLVRASLALSPEEPQLYPRVSPDGRAVVYALRDERRQEGTESVLFLRRLDARDAVRLPGTEGVQTASFSPDGGALAVVVGGEGDGRRVLRVVLDEGPPRTVPIGPYAPDPNLSSGLVWTDADQLVTTGNRGRILSMPADGGAWREVRIAGIPAADGYDPDVFRALPGGRHVLGVTFTYGKAGFEPWVVAIDVESGEARQIEAGGHGAWLPGGHLLFSRGESLLAAPFDPDGLRVTGPARLLLEGLRTDESWRPGWFDVARDGTLVHWPGGRQGTRRRLVLAGPEGETTPWSGGERAFDGALQVARDGSFLTVSVVAASGLLELWGSEVGAPLLRPLLAEPATDFMAGPIDAVNGCFYFTRIDADRGSSVWRAPLQAPERAELVWSPGERRVTLLDVTPDGSSLLVRVTSEDGVVLHDVPASGVGEGGPEPRALFELDADSWGLDVSPDGRWLVHRASMDGRWQMVLRRRRPDGSCGPMIPVPSVDTSGPGAPYRYSWTEWSLRRDAEHPTLLLFSPEGELVEVEVRGESPPTFSAPRRRVSMGERRILDYAGLPDDRILMLVRGDQELLVERIELVLGTRSLLGD